MFYKYENKDSNKESHNLKYSKKPSIKARLIFYLDLLVKNSFIFGATSLWLLPDTKSPM